MRQVSHKMHLLSLGLKGLCPWTLQCPCTTGRAQAASAHCRAPAVSVPGRKGGATRNAGPCSQIHIPASLPPVPPSVPHPGLPIPGTDVKLVSPEGCCSDRGLSEPSGHLLWQKVGHPVLSLETIMEAVWGMQGYNGKQLQGTGNQGCKVEEGERAEMATGSGWGCRRARGEGGCSFGARGRRAVGAQRGW